MRVSEKSFILGSHRYRKFSQIAKELNYGVNQKNRARQGKGFGLAQPF